MIAAIAMGVHADWADCVRVCVQPQLQPLQPADPVAASMADARFAAFRALRAGASPVWAALARARASN